MAHTLRNLAVITATGAAAAAYGRRLIHRSRHFDWQGRTAVITGGSRGLGLVLARQLVTRGVRVALLARTAADLHAAKEELEQQGGAVLALECDVRNAQRVSNCVQQVKEQWGAVDLLFNVAGVIHVGPLESMTAEDFHHAMDTNCWGTLHAVQAVLPGMKQRRWGRIVNVVSLGGKRAVPHMLPYAVSKFAQRGLSKGLRTELAQHDIWVTTVCPSLMRTGSPRNAIFKGRHREEFTWFSIGDALPVISMPAEEAASQVLTACQNGQNEVLLRGMANVGLLLQDALPKLTQELLRYANRALPAMGGIGRQAARGYDSHSRWSPSWITQLSDQAARRNNQMREHPIEPTP